MLETTLEWYNIASEAAVPALERSAQLRTVSVHIPGRERRGDDGVGEHVHAPARPDHPDRAQLLDNVGVGLNPAQP